MPGLPRRIIERTAGVSRATCVTHTHLFYIMSQTHLGDVNK